MPIWSAERMRGLRLVASLLLAVTIAASSPSRAIAEELVTIPTRPGVTLNYMLMAPLDEAVAVAILFAGGGGRLVTWKRGVIERGGNFLVRSRNLFASGGLVAIVVDVPSDRREKVGLRGFRSTAEHHQDLAALIAHVRRVEKLPVWLIGTSRGTLSAAFAGPLMDPAAGDGVVLTSSLTVASRKWPATVFDAPLKRITAPVLVVHHRNDECNVTPYGKVPDIVRELSRAKVSVSMAFEGGDPATGGACGGKSAHGFLGIEPRVVAEIVKWVHHYARR